jgi:hypothetical protein
MARCMRCNRNIPVVMGCMIFELCTTPVHKREEQPVPKATAAEKAVEVWKSASAKLKKPCPRPTKPAAKAPKKPAPTPKKPLTQSSAAEILFGKAGKPLPGPAAVRRKAAKGFSFVYASGFRFVSNVGLFKRALVEKVPGIKSRDLLNVDYVGRNVEFLVPEDRKPALEEGLAGLGLEVVSFDPVSGVDGEFRFRSRMQRVGRRVTAPAFVRSFAEELSRLSGEELLTRLRRCGSMAADTTARGVPLVL